MPTCLKHGKKSTICNHHIPHIHEPCLALRKQQVIINFLSWKTTRSSHHLADKNIIHSLRTSPSLAFSKVCPKTPKGPSLALLSSPSIHHLENTSCSHKPARKTLVHILSKTSLLAFSKSCPKLQRDRALSCLKNHPSIILKLQQQPLNRSNTGKNLGSFICSKTSSLALFKICQETPNNLTLLLLIHHQNNILSSFQHGFSTCRGFLQH